MGLVIYFTSLSVLLLLSLLPAEPRTFPGELKTVVIIYETTSSSRLQPLDDLPALLSALTKQDSHDDQDEYPNYSNDGSVSRHVVPIPKSTPPSPKAAPPKSELTSHHIMTTAGGEATVGPFSDDGSVVGRKKLTPPPTPKPDSPTHYIAPRGRAPPGKSAWSLLTYI